MDRHVGPIKTRRRGLTAGEVVLSVAKTVLGGGDFLIDLDHQRAGRAHGKRLRRELICIPARVLQHARTVVLRPAPEHRHGTFGHAWTTLVVLPTLPAP